MEKVTSEVPSEDVSTGTRCKNCDSQTAGPWCSNCGQHASPSDPTWHEFLHEATHEFLHLDGKIFLTLRLLFSQPGELTAEHLRGRRVRYIGAVRLYLTMSLAYFLIAAIIPNADFKPNANAASSSIAAREEKNVDSGRNPNTFFSRVKAGSRIAGASPEFSRDLVHDFPKVFFVMVPFFAALLKAAYRNRGGHYPKYLYLSLHIHAAAFGFLILALPLQAFAPDIWITAGQLIILLGCFAYLIAALRKLFGDSLTPTFFRALAVTVTYFTGFAAVTACLVVAILYYLGASASGGWAGL